MDPWFRKDEALFFGISVRQADAAFILLAFAFLYLHLFILPATPIYYEMDHVALLNDAKRMLEGEVIYRDFFEFVFPGSHLLYYVFLKVFGPKYWVANVLILAHGLASTAICLALSRQIIGKNIYSYLPAAIYLYLGFRWLGIDGEHRMFSPIFAYLAVLVLVPRRTVSRIALAGAFCGVSSFFTQQRGALALAAIGIFLLYDLGIREREWRRSIVAGGILVGSYSATLLALLLPFMVLAGPRTFYESTILFVSNYVQDPNTNGLQTYLFTITKLWSSGYLITAIAMFYHLLIPLVYVIAAAVLWIRRRRGTAENEAAVLLVCLIGVFFAIGTFAPNAGRLFQIAVPAVVLLGWLIYQFRPKSDLFARFAVLALIVFGSFQAVRLQTGWQYQILRTPSGDLAFLSPVMLERYAWLSERAEPDDYAYETYNAHVNFPLALRNPSRVSILLNTGYAPESQVRQAINDLKSKNARYIIWDGAWTPEMQTLRDDEKLKPLYLFMIQNYELRRRFTPYDGREPEIWERKAF